MTTPHAGTWGPDTITDVSGRPLRRLPVTLYELGTTSPATRYADRDRTPASGALATDEAGNLVFYAEPGRYDAVAGGQRLTLTIPPDAEDVAAAIGREHQAKMAVAVAKPLTGSGLTGIGIPAGWSILLYGQADPAENGIYTLGDDDSLTLVVAVADMRIGDRVYAWRDTGSTSPVGGAWIVADLGGATLTRLAVSDPNPSLFAKAVSEACGEANFDLSSPAALIAAGCGDGEDVLVFGQDDVTQNGIYQIQGDSLVVEWLVPAGQPTVIACDNLLVGEARMGPCLFMSRDNQTFVRTATLT